MPHPPWHYGLVADNAPSMSESERILDGSDGETSSSTEDEAAWTARRGLDGSGGETDRIQMYLYVSLFLTYAIAALCLYRSGVIDSRASAMKAFALIFILMFFRMFIVASNFVIGWKWVLPKFVGMSPEDVNTFIGPGNIPLPTWIEKYDERKFLIRDSLQRKIPHILIILAEIEISSKGLKYFGVTPGEVVFATVAHISFVIGVQTLAINYRNSMTLNAWIWTTALWFSCCRVRDGCYRYSNCLVVSVSNLWGRFITNMLWWHCVLPFFPESERTLLLQLVWMPLAIGDAMAEIIGGCFGKHFFEVCGAGEINKKTLEGVAAMWLSSAGSSWACVFIAWSKGDLASGSPAWWCLWVCASTTIATIAETWSPRGTDNLTIPLGTALMFLAAAKSSPKI